MITWDLFVSITTTVDPVYSEQQRVFTKVFIHYKSI
jgi:hypothetical protein